MNNNTSSINRRQAIGLGSLAAGAALALPGCRALVGPVSGTKGRQGVHHVCVRVADPDRSARFYTEGLACREVYRWQAVTAADPTSGITFNIPGVFLDTGDGSMIRLIRADAGEASPLPGALHHFAFRVEDTAARYRQALAAGGRPYTTPTEAGEWDGSPLMINLDGDPPAAATVAVLQGPDGERIELFQSTSFMRPGEAPRGPTERYEPKAPGRL